MGLHIRDAPRGCGVCSKFTQKGWVLLIDAPTFTHIIRETTAAILVIEQNPVPEYNNDNKPYPYPNTTAHSR